MEHTLPLYDATPSARNTRLDDAQDGRSHPAGVALRNVVDPSTTTLTPTIDPTTHPSSSWTLHPDSCEGRTDGKELGCGTHVWGWYEMARVRKSMGPGVSGVGGEGSKTMSDEWREELGCGRRICG